MKYLKSNSTGKQGVNYIRSLVVNANSIFHEIDTSNDLGVDAVIEIIVDEVPTNRAISVQIKSGNSFYKDSSRRCEFLIGKHRQYWENYHTDLFAIVFVPNLNAAYWIDLKNYLRQFPSAKKVSFPVTRVNLLKEETFEDIFFQLLLGRPPKLSFDQAMSFFLSSNSDEFNVGIHVLFSHYGHVNSVWDLFVKCFLERSKADIPLVLLHYLSYCPWHADLVFRGESFTVDSRKYGRQLLSAFGKSEVVKLLSFIKSEMDLDRGRIGQSVEAIISVVSSRDSILESIILDVNLPFNIREYAGVIYAYYTGLPSIPILRVLHSSNLIDRVISFMEEFDQNFELYI